MSDLPDKDEMPRPEQIPETMKEVDVNGLDDSKRSPGFMTEPAPTLTDVEFEQYPSLNDFDGPTMFDGDWMGQVAEGFDQSNETDSDLDLNAFPATIDEHYLIVKLFASANEPSIEQKPTDTSPADTSSLENPGLSQEQQDDFFNMLNGTSPEDINLWYAGTVATQANPDDVAEQNVEGRIPRFTQQDQAILNSFGPAIADEISAKYPTQDGLNMAGSQSLHAPTAQDTVLQGSEQLGGTSNMNSFEDPISSRVLFKDDATTQDELDSLVEWTENNFPSNSLDFDQYDETFLSVQKLSSSPTNHDKNTVSNHQGSKFQSSTKIQDSAPVMIVQQSEFHQNQAGAAQNRFEHNSLGGRGEYDEYSRVMQMQSEDKSAHAPPPVDNANDVVSQRNGNGHRVKTSQGSRKRAGWETRPDAARPRVRMTEEEYKWLRPNEGPRDVFETQRKKAAEERLNKEAEADALEKAGMPRPQPKVQKPYKGGIHIEVFEKERLNNRRRAQGKSGRDLFSEKPKLRGKRKSREMSEAKPQPNSKKMKLEESGRFESHSEIREINEGLTHDAYPSLMPAVDRFNRGMKNGALSSMPPSGVAYPSVGQGSRPEYDGAHQARAVYSHNQPLGSFHSQSEQKATASYGRNSVPPPPYVESVQQSTNFPP
ncbi:hypothetical protein BHYA_0129g00140 [Botrytis hyacinthi]|uniref:Uncharacterized protein n=1 Tax=Botrytis hyacinthi TaxID=278943 RepID=A0A4Z1GRP1_9HELO|nr:hypothetical protein BHYA_0129g00140 [Botrytis hyacinthi]